MVPLDASCPQRAGSAGTGQLQRAPSAQAGASASPAAARQHSQGLRPGPTSSSRPPRPGPGAVSPAPVYSATCRSTRFEFCPRNEFVVEGKRACFLFYNKNCVVHLPFKLRKAKNQIKNSAEVREQPNYLSWCAPQPFSFFFHLSCFILILNFFKPFRDPFGKWVLCTVLKAGAWRRGCALRCVVR